MPDAVKLSDLDVDRVDAVDKPATKSRFLIMKSEDADELRKNLQSFADGADGLLDLIAKDSSISAEIKGKAAEFGKTIGRTEKALPATQAECEAAGGTWAGGACTYKSAEQKAAESAAEIAKKAACTKCAAPITDGKFVSKEAVRKGDTCPMCGAPVNPDGNYEGPAGDATIASAKSVAPTAAEIAAEVAKALTPALTQMAEASAAVAKAIEAAPKVVSKSDAPRSRQAGGQDEPEAEPVKKKDGKIHFDSVIFGQK